MLPIVMAALILTIFLGIILSSVYTGRFTPWSSAPIRARKNPVVFCLYLAICLLVAMGLMLGLWRFLEA
ncbi:MAG: hypothetical protein EA349_15005 [Halomonadaceae bacterium]|nr:MAG: hypothetical protein EA349_15005 [Halomonadaceae bacterium]